MRYCIIDLEWNNVYAKKIRGYLNEIIEIGAVMLGEDLAEISTFGTFVKAQVSKKLHSSIKQLTHISIDDINSGVVFTKAMSDMRRWIGSEDCVVVTWGDGDIRTLIQNYRYLNGIKTVPFLTHYADLQKYFQDRMALAGKNQISLANAAAMVEVEDDGYEHHRALDDSLITAQIFRKSFDLKEFQRFFKPCNAAFSSRLSFKPHFIGSMSDPMVKKTLASRVCEKCGAEMTRLTDWKYVGRGFRALFYCSACDEYKKLNVSFKKLYDNVEIKSTSVTVQDYSTEEKQDAEQ